MRNLLVLSFYFGFFNGCGGANQSLSDTKIVGGAVTRDFPAVVLLQLPDSTCTGTFITTSVVLTASHCVFDLQGGLLPPEVIRVSGRHDAAQRVQIPSSLGGQFPPPADPRDVALIHFLALPQQPTIPLALDPGVNVGDTVAFVGFGVDSMNESERKDREPTKRVGFNTVSKRDHEVIYIEAYQYKDPRAEGASPLMGDSGGPLLAGDKVIGVVSGASDPNVMANYWGQKKEVRFIASNNPHLRELLANRDNPHPPHPPGGGVVPGQIPGMIQASRVPGVPVSGQRVPAWGSNASFSPAVNGPMVRNPYGVAPESQCYGDPQSYTCFEPLGQWVPNSQGGLQ